MILSLRSVMILCPVLVLAIGCGEKKDDNLLTFRGSLSSEAAIVNHASENLEFAADDANGILTGQSAAPSSFTNFFLRNEQEFASIKSIPGFDPATDCKDSGTLDETKFNLADPLSPLFDIYCRLKKQSDGPDTARGALDRATGVLCALGTIDYSGTPVNKTISISTACFSQTFVTAAVQHLGTTSIPVIVTGSTTGVPTGFDKIITIENPANSNFDYFVAVKSSANEKSIAVVDTDDQGTFSIYMNNSTGVMKIEGRFPDHDRQFRMHLTGTLNSNFEVVTVNDLHFINSEANGGGFSSLSGPSTGRRLLLSDISHAGHNTCQPSTGNCAGNAGLSKGTGFGGLSTASTTWFMNNSYLGTVGDLTTVNNEDIWQ